MNIEEALAFVHAPDWRGSRPGLGRIRTLCALLGNPQEELRYIHVAGSNGKGSVCAMLSSVLTCAGYRTGMYTSPHLVRLNERFQVNGKEIGDQELADLIGRIAPYVRSMEDPPTEFELLTAAALLYFREQRCDIVVLEVGLGGTLDSTNVIPAPEVAVIANIGLEHTEILGPTLAQIAAAKAGIIKPGSEAVVYPISNEALATVRRACADRMVPLHMVTPRDIRPEEETLTGQTFGWKQLTGLRLRLIGAHQRMNAAVALETLLVLRRRGWRISQKSLRRGLERTSWPGRFEVLGEEPPFIVDGGHNAQCAEALSKCLDAYLPGRRVVFLMGVLSDKDYGTMVDILAPHAARFVCLTPDSPRALAAADLASYLADRGLKARAAETIGQGIHMALCSGDPVVACGSLYLTGYIREQYLSGIASGSGLAAAAG